MLVMCGLDFQLSFGDTRRVSREDQPRETIIMSKLTLNHYYMYVGASYARQYPIRKTEKIGQSVKDEISKKREHDKKIKRAKIIFEIAVWSIVVVYILINHMFF